VYCYDSGGTLIAETISDEYGDYVLENVPPGIYDVKGETLINDQPYSAWEYGVQVFSGAETPFVTLVLY
jgi:hypothetical protein